MILLENLHVILEKTPRDDIRKEVLPLLYTAFDFSDIEVQASLTFINNNDRVLHEEKIRFVKCGYIFIPFGS